MELSVTLAGITLQHPLMNAAGTCKLLEGEEGLDGLLRSETAAVMIGSATFESRPGNTGEVYYAGPGFSLNSLGLPNPGAAYYREKLPTMVSLAHDAGKPLFLNVAGFSPEEYATLVEVGVEGGADLIELNLGCPNIWGDSGQKRIACFDPGLVAEILDAVKSRVGCEACIAVKISPFSDPFALQKVAKVISLSGMVNVVTTVNTFPNAFSFNESGKPRITPGEGLAGMGGPAMKPIGLGQVRQLKALLPAHIQIIGVGGISTGQDILDYIRAGAGAVQIATTYLERRASVFSVLLSELVEAIDTHVS